MKLVLRGRPFTPTEALAGLAGALLLAYLVLVPLLPLDQWQTPHDVARLLQWPVFMACTLTLLLQPPPRATPPVRWAGLLAGTLLLASTAGADLPAVAMRELLLLLSLLAVVLALPQLLGASRWRYLQIACVLAPLFYGAVYMLMALADLASGTAPDGWRMVFGYSNPRFLNHVQTVQLPLLIGIHGADRLGRPWHRLTALALLCQTVLMAATQGRATMLGVLAALCAALVLNRRLVLPMLRKALWPVVAGVALWLLLFIVLPRVLHLDTATYVTRLGDVNSMKARLYLWDIAWRDILAAPLLGIGPMHYAHHFNGEAAHPHNVYLQSAAELGLPLTLLWMVMLAAALRASLRWLRTHRDDAWALGVLCAVVGALIDGGFSGNFVMPMAQTWIAAALGVLLTQQLPPPETETANRRMGSRMGWRVALTLLLLAQALVFALSIRDLDPRVTQLPSAETLDLVGMQHLSPRYWQQGWF